MKDGYTSPLMLSGPNTCCIAGVAQNQHEELKSWLPKMLLLLYIYCRLKVMPFY